MLAPALAALTAVVVAGDHGGLPFFTLHTLDLGPLPLQPFGIIVAAGVLIGAEVMRRYMLRFGVDEDDIRGLTLWLIVYLHVFLGVLRPHRTGDRDLVTRLAQTRQEAARGRPRLRFHLAVVSALGMMALLVYLRHL